MLSPVATVTMHNVECGTAAVTTCNVNAAKAVPLSENAAVKAPLPQFKEVAASVPTLPCSSGSRILKLSPTARSILLTKLNDTDAAVS